MKLSVNSQVYLVVVFFVVVILFVGTSHQEPSPSFPTSYFTQVYIESTRKFNYDIIYDHKLAKYRIDSYGVPLSKLPTALLGNKLPSSIIAKIQQFEDQIAMKDNGYPLYSFVFDYSKQPGLLYALWPFDCTISHLYRLPQVPTLSTSFEDLLGNATYVGTETIHGEETDHFVRNYVITQIDYFQSREAQPVPKRITVGLETFTFFNTTIGSPNPEYWIVPKDCHFDK